MKIVLKFLAIFGFLLLGNVFCHGQCTDEYYDLIFEAEKSQMDKNYKASVDFFKSAFIEGVPIEKDCYLAAVSFAETGDFTNAFKYLNLSVDKGFMNKTWLLEDEHFVQLQDQPEWNLLMQKIDKSVSGLNQKWRNQLAAIQEKDQRYRGKLKKMTQEFGWGSEVIFEKWEEQKMLDSLNLIEVKAFLDENGYPGKSDVGDLASVPYFVLQRADLETQEAYLRMLKRAAYRKKISWSRLATFVDKMKVRNYEQQIFGTQIIQYEDGSYDFYEIFEPEFVDNRRIHAGLPPIRIEAKRWGIAF